MLNFKSVYSRALDIYQTVSHSLGEIQEQGLDKQGSINTKQVSSQQDFLFLEKIKNKVCLGYVIRSSQDVSLIDCFFENNETQKLAKPIGLPRCVPLFKNERDLKPVELPSFGDQSFTFIHFWLNPEQELSLVVGLDRKASDLQERLMHVHHLIQRLYYD